MSCYSCGDYFYVPGTDTPEVYGQAVYAEALQCPAGSIPYTIRAGDSFYAIAQRLGTTVAAIVALNPGVDPNRLQVGQQICVPGGIVPPPQCTGTLYVIRAGDTFFAIAARFGVTLQALIAANPGVNPNQLTVGQTICIPTRPSLITTPCTALLQPVTSALPPASDIPTGAVVVRQVAMSTRAYTVVASGLPNPSEAGNYNSYIAVLRLFNIDTGQRTPLTVRLVSSQFGNQIVTWSGGIITVEPPIAGDTVEVRPFNSTTGTQGPIFLQANLTNCRA